MAKIITQISLFDYSEIEELGDLERLRLALEGIDDEELMLRLEKNVKMVETIIQLELCGTYLLQWKSFKMIR